MSINNQISIEIPQKVLDDALQDLQKVKTALAPYLKGLTDKEK